MYITQILKFDSGHSPLLSVHTQYYLCTYVRMCISIHIICTIYLSAGWYPQMRSSTLEVSKTRRPFLWLQGPHLPHITRRKVLTGGGAGGIAGGSPYGGKCSRKLIKTISRLNTQ